MPPQHTSIDRDDPDRRGESSKKVKINNNPPELCLYPPTMGSWAYDKPVTMPCDDAAAWSTRQLHDAVEGQVHKYEPHVDLPELQETQKKDWYGKVVEDDSGTVHGRQASPSTTFADILNELPKPASGKPKSEASLKQEKGLSKAVRRNIDDAYRKAKSTMPSFSHAEDPKNSGQFQHVSFDAQLGIISGAPNIHLRTAGARFGRMIDNVLTPQPQNNANRPPTRVPTRKPVPFRSKSSLMQLVEESPLEPPLSPSPLPPPASRPVETLRRESTDFRDFLRPERITTWDVDDASRKSLSSLSSVTSGMLGMKKLGKRALEKANDKMEEHRREKRPVQGA